jgi:LAO/AO transport system kinase
VQKLTSSSSSDRTRPSWVPPDAGAEFTTSVAPGVTSESGVFREQIKRPQRTELPPAELAAAILAGDRAALSRAITLIESNAPAHRPAARELLHLLSPHSGKARRLGISGVPGAGKSTFIEALGNFLCDRGHRVAVLAVDPSSSLTGGSILGDKTRMELLSRRPECFIRPSPSGGALGGVTRKTRETLLACEAAGYDLILVETVGVGQSEIAVRAMVDCFLLLLIAGAGDELQGMKKGIFEIADLVVVNKADGDNRPRALATRSEFERVLHFLTPATPGWSTPVLTASALHKENIDAVWQGVGDYFSHVETEGLLTARRREQNLAWWRALVEQELHRRFLHQPEVAHRARELEQKIRAGTLAPSLAAEELLELLPNPKASQSR